MVSTPLSVSLFARDSVGKIQQVSIKKGTVIGDSTRVVTSCLAKSRLDLLEVQRRET